MKKLMMMGAIVGFSIGIIFGLLHESTWPSILWRGSVAALIAGLLMRWWGKLWIQGLRESLENPEHVHDAGSAGINSKS
jgi:hypothetical protein